MPHIVDVLIEERAEGLRRRPLLWQGLRACLYPLLGYREAVQMADEIAPLQALEVFRYLSARLELDVRAAGLEHVPAEGLAIVAANHPSGIADGIAVFDVLSKVRSDISFFANRDAIRVCPGLVDMLVPVEWMTSRRDHARRRETVRGIVQALRERRLIVIFPSGRLARPTLRGLVEREWQPGALNVAIKHAAPVIPLYISGRNSWLYYLFYAIHHELRDITLFRELLNKRGRRYEIRIGRAFEPRGDPAVLGEALRRFVTEQLPAGTRAFNPPDTLSPARSARRHSS